MTDRRVNDIVVCTAAQLMKTTALNNGIGYFMEADPSAILYLAPTLDDAKDWMRDKFMPMIRSSPKLRRLIPDEGTRTTGQTTLMKHFPGGRIKAAGANSPATLRGRSFRIVIQDDVDGFRDNAEGDPSSQADRRAANQPRALRMKFSTPTLKDGSRIWNFLEQSTFEQLLCPCPKCDHPQTLEWTGMVFDEARPEDARYKCCACDALWDDTERYNAVIEGCRRELWSVRNPQSRIKGLHMNGLYRLMGEKNSMSGFLEEWVRDYTAAKKGGEKTFQVWTNTFLALCYEPANSTVEPDPLFKRREPYRPWERLPEEILVVIAAVDVQGNRLEVETRGFGLGQESWGLEYREIPGDPTERLVWDKLDQFLAQTYEHPIRGKIRVAFCFVDAGGNKQNEAYKYTSPRNGRGIYACRGAKDPNAPVLSSLKKSGYQEVPFYMIGVGAIKDTLHSRLLLKEPGPGYLHWPTSDDYDEEYFKKLTAEKKVRAQKGMRKGQMIWFLREGARNEPWDIAVYQIAALEAAGFTERHLRAIDRDNQRLRAQMNLPPKPPSGAQTLDALKAPPGPSLSLAEVKAQVDPSVAQVPPQSPPLSDPPKRYPWKVRGVGKSGLRQFDFSGWGG